mmetsp:Transcript_118132/g.294594  ORF Transcript_118132/g.294594 Transcript_118132/m.294594 type:complete len:1402 (-) Transcript_118132:48-4253(-)
MAFQPYAEPLYTSETEEDGEEACCLYWVLQADQDQIDAAVIHELHEELRVCTRNLGACVVEAGATAGALARYCSGIGTDAPGIGQGSPSVNALVPMCPDDLHQLAAPFASQPSRGSSPGGEAPKRKPSAADYMVRLGQLLARWAAKQDVLLDLRVGVHCGRLKSFLLPGGDRVGYYGEALGCARRLAVASPRDACVHLSRAAKDSLQLLEYLAFSCTPSQLGQSYCLESWTQAVDEPECSPVAGLSDSPPPVDRRRFDTMFSSDVNGQGSTLSVPPPPQCDVLTLEESMTVDEFRDLLAAHRMDVWQFGRGQARTLEDFHRRVVVEKKARLCIGSEGALEQQVEIVKINFMARAPSGEDFQLALTSEILQDGRARSRANKFAHPVAVGRTIDEALEECFQCKLRLEPAVQREVLFRDPAVSLFEQERAPSPTSAGIMTTYFKHEVSVQVIDSTRPELQSLGLPSCQPFTTPADPQLNIPECNWAWHPPGEQSSSQAALSQLLQRHGIDVATYPRTALAELWDEIYDAKYSTLAVREDRELERRINVIKVWLCTELLGLEHLLVKRWQFEAGKTDTRVKDRPVSMRMTMDQSWEDAVHMNILDKLGLDIHFQQQHLSVDERSYRLSEEVAYSHRYPGLRTLYLIHEVKCRIPDPLAPGMEVIGLPDGNDFAVTRFRKLDNKEVGSIATGWSWKPIASMGHSLHHALSRRSLLDRHPFDCSSTAQKRRLPVPPPLEAAKVQPASEVMQSEGRASTAPQLPLKPSRKFSSQCLLQSLMCGRKPNLERALNAAQRIRDENYTCRQYLEDCLAAFPELALYVSGQDMMATGGGVDATPATSAGRTAEDEYQRTMGALFAVYWLMRLDSDGAQSFCFGIDDDWYPLSESSTLPARSMQERKKRQAFLENTPWQELERLFFDAGLLRGGPSERTHDIDRTLAMLVLTAIHDIMKIQALVPVVAEEHGPWCGYQIGEKVGDHDAALGYVLEFMPELLPSFAMLPRAQRCSVKFTQCKMDFNMGWLVQAEAHPGALFSRFKAVMLSGEVRASDVAFYFVHWLTDLAGAEPCPQEGCEKFVLNFPQRALASFMNSFSIVQRLSAQTETQVLEDYLLWRWRTTEGKGLGPPPGGPGAIARLRLVVMAQGGTKKVLNALRSLPREDVAVLEEELALTGCAGQRYVCEQPPSLHSSEVSRGGVLGDRAGDVAPSEGPALMVYYAPALMQKAGKVDPAGALLVLADVLRQARSLYPASPTRADETVIVRIDALKDLEVRAMKEAGAPGEVWILERMSGKDAQVRRVNLTSHQKVGVNWSTSRILFADRPRVSLTKSRAWCNARKSSTWNVIGGPTPRSRNTSHSPTPRHQQDGGNFWHRSLSGLPSVGQPDAVASSGDDSPTKRSPKNRVIFKSN